MRKPTDADLRLAPDNVQEYIAQLEKDRDAQAEAVRVLAAECEMSRVCVEPDPIYGWDEPRHLADHYMDWRELGKMREQTDANPIAAAAVKEAGQ